MERKLRMLCTGAIPQGMNRGDRREAILDGKMRLFRFVRGPGKRASPGGLRWITDPGV